jgi:hypothetical protein
MGYNGCMIRDKPIPVKEQDMCGECNWPIENKKETHEMTIEEWLEEYGHEDLEDMLDELLKEE